MAHLMHFDVLSLLLAGGGLVVCGLAVFVSEP